MIWSQLNAQTWATKLLSCWEPLSFCIPTTHFEFTLSPVSNFMSSSNVQISTQQTAVGSNWSILRFGDWNAQNHFYSVIPTCSPSQMVIGVGPPAKRHHEMWSRPRIGTTDCGRDKSINIMIGSLKCSEPLPPFCAINMLSKPADALTWSHELRLSNVMARVKGA